ncbi:MAG: hypothetical protein JO269_10465 [Burkholderiaceae bacterium]|nr:hypothetical protein [Burkholderiaceae bacterium]
MAFTSIHSFSSASVPRARAAAPWRVWTALLTAITFAVLVATAATHHHASVVEDQDCAVCGVVTHKLADPPPVVLLRPVLILVSYLPYLAVVPLVRFSSPLLLPPACGPPTLSSTSC